jgi:hypothetical protein
MGLKKASGAEALVLGVTLAACAQAPAVAGPDSGAQVMFSSGGLASAENLRSGAQGEIIREIDDPHTGDRWLLVRNDQLAGGPGRLVLVAAHHNASDGATVRSADQAREARFLPVIRTGDRLIVEEHTARVDAVLEARALNPAMSGAALDVRLTIGGNVVRAIAMGPGRATLQPKTGVRP